MKKIAIFGLGLMGGSLCAALKRNLRLVEVVGYTRRRSVLRRAEELGWLDEAYEDPLEAAARADLAVCCLPIKVLPELWSRCLPAWRKKRAIVTDVGSTKEWLAQRAGELLQSAGVIFVGSHPMAGSELSGIEAADPDIYNDACTLVCPSGAPDYAVSRVCDLWRAAGARPRIIDARAHDRLVARNSHLPHAAAVALAATVTRDPDSADPRIHGRGLLDTTRVAAGSTAVWEDIFTTNSEAVIAELEELEKMLASFRDCLRKGDEAALRSILESGRRARRQITAGGEL